MATHKIKISTNATWFEVTLDDDAFWILPDSGDELSIDSKNAQNFFVRLTKRNLLFDADDGKGNGGTSQMIMYVETNEDKIVIRASSADKITFSSDVGHFEPSVFGGESGVLQLS